MNQMNLTDQRSPSFKIVIPIVTIYTVCLFIPTIDIAATYHINLIYFSITFPVALYIFPMIYPLSDSITEVYGKVVALYITMTCYLCVVFFSVVNNFVLYSSDNYGLYHFLLNQSVLVTIAGPIGYIITSYINIRLINKLKIITRGRNFIIRSFICSGLSGSILSIIIYPIIFYTQDAQYIMKIILSVIFVKLLVTIPFVFLAKFLVLVYRYIDGIDIQTYNKLLISELSKGI